MFALYDFLNFPRCDRTMDGEMALLGNNVICISYRQFTVNFQPKLFHLIRILFFKGTLSVKLVFQRFLFLKETFPVVSQTSHFSLNCGKDLEIANISPENSLFVCCVRTSQSC